MGPSCRYCGNRCFVLRTMPGDALRYAGRELLLATCPAGMDHDRRSTGHDHTTAFNPDALWPPGPAQASPSAEPGDLPHIDEPPAAQAAPPPPAEPPTAAVPLQARPCEVCGVQVSAAFIARTGRAVHVPCARAATHPDPSDLCDTELHDA